MVTAKLYGIFGQVASNSLIYALPRRNEKLAFVANDVLVRKGDTSICRVLRLQFRKDR